MVAERARLARLAALTVERETVETVPDRDPEPLDFEGDYFEHFERLSSDDEPHPWDRD